MDPRHAILFEPVRIGPKTLPNRFYQVPHASGFGSHQPRTQAAFRAIKAEGGWGGVCVEYAPVSRTPTRYPAVAADIWDDADAAGAGADRRRDPRPRGAGRAGAVPRRRAQRQRGSRLARLAPTQRRPRSVGRPGQGDDGRRYRPRPAGLGAGRPARRRRRLRHRLRVRGARLPGDPVPVAATNRRTDGYGGSLAEPGPVLAGDPGGGAGGGRRRMRGRDPDPVHGDSGCQGRGLPGIEIDEMLALVAMADDLVDLWDVTVGSWPEDSGTSRYYPEGSQRPWTTGSARRPRSRSSPSAATPART